MGSARDRFLAKDDFPGRPQDLVGQITPSPPPRAPSAIFRESVLSRSLTRASVFMARYMVGDIRSCTSSSWLSSMRERGDGSTKAEGDGRVSDSSFFFFFFSFFFLFFLSLLAALGTSGFVETRRDAKIYDCARAKKSRREKDQGSLVKTSRVF